MPAQLQATTNTQIPVSQLYRKLEIVGKGGYGAVYRGVHVPTGQVVALKIIDLDTPDDDVADIQREVALLSQLRAENNNITKYYGCWLEGPKVWIVMDFASGGSVRTLMKALPDGMLEERSNVIHRDIKAANILIQSTGKVVLCDFGVSALLSTSYAKRTTFIGTPHYMAPEVLTSSAYDSKADIWSLGISLFEMATGAQPLAEVAQLQAINLIPKVKPPKLGEQYGSKEMRDFLTHCLRELPSDRLSADELSRTKWIKGSNKQSVAILKNLLIRYDQWAQAGGIRQSLADPAPWEIDGDKSDLEDAMDRSSWAFDTIRATSNEVRIAEDAGIPDQTSSLLNRQLPESLRVLFDDGSLTPSVSEPDFLRQFEHNLEGSSLKPSASSSSLPDIENIIEGGSDITARAPGHRSRNHRSGRSNQRPTLTSEFKHENQTHSQTDTEAPEGDQYDLLREKMTQSDSEPSSSSHIQKNSGKTDDRVLTLVRKRTSPLDFRFPRNTSSRGVTPITPIHDSPSPTSPNHIVTHSVTASLDSTRSLNSRYVPGSITAAQPTASAQISRKPSLQRQMSVAVMEHLDERPQAQESPIPLLGVRRREKPATGSKSNIALKDVLKLSPFALDGTLSADMLPPSPSVVAVPSRYFPVPGVRANQVLSSTTPSPLMGERPTFSDLQPSGPKRGISISPTPYMTPQTLPTISPLDIPTLLRSREETHSQLAKTVEDLSTCLQVVERGFDTILSTAFGGITEEPLEDLGYSPESETR